MNVPFLTLNRQYQRIKKELDEAVIRVMSHCMFTLGPEVTAFEQEFARYLGISHAVGVASGTDALTLSLKALKFGRGDEVIVPANSYPTVFGVALSGITIRLCDCDRNGNISVESLERVISKKTKAVVAVHLYGNPADIYGIQKLIKSKNLDCSIIEDAAQAHGAEIYVSRVKYHVSRNTKIVTRDTLTHDTNGKKVGTIGDIGIFSFYPTKNLGAYGDGGMIVTKEKNIAEHVRRLRMYGESSRYHSEEISGVSRLDELQAAILRVKLRHLDEWNRRRTEIVRYYYQELEGVGDISILSKVKNQKSKAQVKNQKFTSNQQLTINDQQSHSCHHLFVIRTKRRDQLKAYLEKNGIGSSIHYPVPIHLTKSFRYLGYKNGDFPEAEALSKEVLSLPLYPELTNDEREQVVAAVKNFYNKRYI